MRDDVHKFNGRIITAEEKLGCTEYFRIYKAFKKLRKRASKE